MDDGTFHGGVTGGYSLRIAVTGATGFIGSHLVPALLKSGSDVREILEPGKVGLLRNSESREADVASGDGLNAAFEGVDAVVHLAARNHVLRETAKDPLREYRRVNVDGTRNAVGAASASGVKVFLHVSSVKAMGECSERRLTENDECRPETPYGISKMESEKVIRDESARSGMRAFILRLPMVYGPGNKGNLPRMIRWADSGLPFPLPQPDNLRSMIFVGNVVAAIIAVLRNPPTEGAGVTTYMVSDREDYSTRRLYSTICRTLGKPSRFLRLPGLLVRCGGMFVKDLGKISASFRVNSEKFTMETGFSPPFSLDDGITETVRWYRRSDR